MPADRSGLRPPSVEALQGLLASQLHERLAGACCIQRTAQHLHRPVRHQLPFTIIHNGSGLGIHVFPRRYAMPSQAEVEALIWSVRVEVARAERLQVEVCWA